MFLNKLTTEGSKRMFLELAFLVAISEDKRNKSNNNYKVRFGDYLTNNEIEILEKYSEDLGLHSYLEVILSGNEIFGFGNEIFSFGMASEDKFNNRLEYCYNHVIEKYSENTNVKNDILKILSEKNINIFHLEKEKLLNEVSNLPEIKSEIINETAKKVILDRRNHIDLKEVEKKVIIFELIFISYANGDFDINERKLIENIARMLEFDMEYIDEFSEVISVLSESLKEVNQLINE